MKKALLFVALAVCTLSLSAQQPARKTDLMVTWLGGPQFFRLSHIEEQSRVNMEQATPYNGFYEQPDFRPVWMHRVEAATSFFGNRTFYIALAASWGKTTAGYNGYTVNSNGHPVQLTGKTTVSFFSLGYGLKRKIGLGKYGILMPGITFNVGKYVLAKTTLHYQARNRVSGEVLNEDSDSYTEVEYSRVSPSFLALLDNPRFSLDYFVKIKGPLYFTASYSYWRLGAIANDVYGLSNSYLLKTRYRVVTRQMPHYNDLFSHNLSIGVCYKLR